MDMTHRMDRVVARLFAITVLGLSGALAPCVAGAKVVKPSASEQPQVEVVFLLDTTGSMSGLIESAKQKIWSIANEIANGKPTPKIRMGLIAYRDRGDAFVSRVFDLSDNLDQMYQELLGLSADGGGDSPEHVLQALSDMVENISWSRDPKAFQVVYLVGDAPPHFEYHDTPDLEKLLQQAVRRGLIVNTIQCGNDSTTTTSWQRIARLAEGQFLAIPQNGGVALVSTPFDDRIAALSERIGRTIRFYGAQRKAQYEPYYMAETLAAAAPRAVAADRAALKTRTGYFDSTDLAEAVRRDDIKLEALPEKDLPEELRGLTIEEQHAKLEAIRQERAAIQQELTALTNQRQRYLNEELKRGARPTGAFDLTLLESLKSQALRKGITY